MVRNHQIYREAVREELDGRFAKIKRKGITIMLGMKQGNNE